MKMQAVKEADHKWHWRLLGAEEAAWLFNLSRGHFRTKTAALAAGRAWAQKHGFEVEEQT